MCVCLKKKKKERFDRFVARMTMTMSILLERLSSVENMERDAQTPQNMVLFLLNPMILDPKTAMVGEKSSPFSLRLQVDCDLT